jgi:PAS domain S-box-containing protein
VTYPSLALALLLLTSCANIALGIAVWRRHPDHRVNQYFALFSFAVGAWVLNNGFVNIYAGAWDGIVWARGAFASAALIPFTFFLFASVFPTRVPSPAKRTSYAFLGAAIGMTALCATPLIAARTSWVNGGLRVAYGPLHSVFALYFVLGLAYSLTLLYRKLRTLAGLEKLRVRYVFLGMSIPILGGTITNLLIPLLFGSSQFSQIGPLFSLLMISVIAHAIIRYRLMNVRLVASSVFIAILWLGSHFLAAPSAVPLSVELLLVVLIALLFQPTKNIVQRYADIYFFREPYDYDRAVREITRQMATLLDLNSLLRYSCEQIAKTVQPEYVAAYGRASSARSYQLLVFQNTVDDAPAISSLDSDSPLAKHLNLTRNPLLADELRHSPTSRDTDALCATLRSLRSELVLPIHDDGSLSGFFLLGQRLSGDPYFSEDIDLLTILTSQAAVAIKNAQLYSQIVRANDYVENILNTVDSAIIAVDRHGAITRFNSGAERLTGLPALQMKGRSLQDLPPTISTFLYATCSDNQSRSQVETTIQPLGRRQAIPVLCSTSPLLDRVGSELGAVAVISDLSGLKRLEEEKRRVERLASIGALASGIAHEIKNPLVAIKTFAELLPERFGEPDFRNDFAKVAIKEVERIDDLVARLRGLAMPSQQPLATLEIKTPLEETIALLRGQLQQKEISLRLHVDPCLPSIAGSPAQLKQLFLNLCINALEATERGGLISIRAYSRSAPDKPVVVVEIADSGPGIPESLLGIIFEPFVTTKPQGSGLGLSICRGIAHAHHATIQAQNNPSGRGVLVSVEFPPLDVSRRDISNDPTAMTSSLFPIAGE